MPPIVAVNTSLGGMKGSTYNSFHKGKMFGIIFFRFDLII